MFFFCTFSITCIQLPNGQPRHRAAARGVLMIYFHCILGFLVLRDLCATKWYPGTSNFQSNGPRQVPLMIHFHWISGSLEVLDLLWRGSRVPKWYPGISKLKKINTARLVWGFIFIEFCTAGTSFWWVQRVPKWCPGHPKRCQNDARGAQKSRKMHPGAPKGSPTRTRAKKHRKYGFAPPRFGHPFWHIFS